MEQTWRWFGPEDKISLPEIRQTGATGIVTALHHVPYGAIWSRDEIAVRKQVVDAAGLRWSVVESLPVAEGIKLGEGDLAPLFENYRQSLRNLAAEGVTTVCYNFMPVLDWTRTQLTTPLPSGGTALRFDAHEYAAFDCFILKRSGSEAEQRPDVLAKAKDWIKDAGEADKSRLLATIMAGLPGAYERYDVPGLRKMLDRYRGIDRDALRQNLKRFLQQVVPTATEVGVRLCIHPDDPPRPLFGLPRIVSSSDDLDFIVGAVDEVANGITLCTGSLGAGTSNNVPAIARRFAVRTHFVHLRNVTKEPDGSFVEAEHLGGDVNLVDVIRPLLQEQARRHRSGDPNWRLPFRPDHGHQLLEDAKRATHPGYPLYGRMRGLAELRGVMKAMSSIEGLPL